MKILLVTEFFPSGNDFKFSGGVEARTFFVAKHLSKKHQVTIITSRLFGTPKEEIRLGFKIIRVGNSRKYKATTGSVISRLKFIYDVIREAKNNSFDIVEGTNFITHFIAKRISVQQKIPVVFWYPDVWVGSWIKNAGLTGIFGEILERVNILSQADCYIAISQTTANKLKNKVSNKVNIIYCGVDQNEFVAKYKKFPNPTLICVSRLAKYKNTKTLIFAFAYLRKKIKNLNLLLVGNGPQKKALVSLSKALNVENHVKFVSNIPRKELIKLYKSSHVFSLPSHVEGFGIATIEAAESGLPYVNSDIEIQREITQNSKGGFLVNPNEPLMFAEKFEDLLNNKTLYSKKSQEAKLLAKSYRWDQIAKQTESVYKSLL